MIIHDDWKPLGDFATRLSPKVRERGLAYAQSAFRMGSISEDDERAMIAIEEDISPDEVTVSPPPNWKFGD